MLGQPIGYIASLSYSASQEVRKGERVAAFERAFAEARVDRTGVYLTNAVKHFKFKPTGRRRLHQSPDAGDITYYRPFLKREIELVGPGLVVAPAIGLEPVTVRLTVGCSAN